MQNSVPEKSGKLNASKLAKSLLYITALVLITYVLLAIITHFSLNNVRADYAFSQSLAAVLDTQTAIFKFVFGFVAISASIVTFAVLVKKIKDKIFDIRNQAKG